MSLILLNILHVFSGLYELQQYKERKKRTNNKTTQDNHTWQLSSSFYCSWASDHFALFYFTSKLSAGSKVLGQKGTADRKPPCSVQVIPLVTRSVLHWKYSLLTNKSGFLSFDTSNQYVPTLCGKQSKIKNPNT